LTAEQLEASRAERLRLNGHETLNLEDARTWLEETGLCLFLPRKQSVNSIAPSFVEAVIGMRNAAPDAKQIAASEALLVRLENDGVAVRLTHRTARLRGGRMGSALRLRFEGRPRLAADSATDRLAAGFSTGDPGL
jgi:hypothetical protein